MGMFDTVHYQCPSCGEVTEAQTKAGDCTLMDYHAYPDGSDLPPTLMAALADRQKARPIICSSCGKRYRLVLINKPTALVQVVPD
jgi:predicted RNA-binding Zn-ribbon protein involved in translation (DUF1610 family)